MEHDLWLYFGLGSLTSSAATWAVCRWWIGRHLTASAQRIAKLEKARLLSGHQTLQARKQLEKLQHEMEGLPRRSAKPLSMPSHVAQLDAVLHTVDHIPPLASAASQGFAETQAFETT